MREYKPYPIFNFRSGFNESVETELLPKDAFPLMENAHLYRGVIEKVAGYKTYAVMSYRRMIQLTGAINGSNKTFTGTLNPLPTTNNIYIQATTDAGATTIESFKSDGLGILAGSAGGSGTVDFFTGAVSVTFGTNAPAMLPSGGNVYNAVLLMYDSAPTLFTDIMGIKPYFGQNGNQDILVFDRVRMGVVVQLQDNMSLIQRLDYGISEVPHQEQTADIDTGFDGTTGPFTGTIQAGITPGTVTFLLFDMSGTLLDTITDNGDSKLVGTTLAGTDNFIDYVTGDWTMTFSGARATTDTMNSSACVFGDVFTGDFTEFFSVDNYQAKAFIVNNVDPPRYYDGMCLMYLNTSFAPNPIDVAPYDIRSALHAVVYRERLLLLSPLVDGVPKLNFIYWSVAENPLDWSNEDFLPATTSQPIRTFAIINTDLIVRFSKSERVFRYTGDEFDPFRWDTTNNLWRCDASYSAINYDSWFSSIGKSAIVGSDGVNIQRADEIIPDFTLPNWISQQEQLIYMDQTSIGQCYGERFDDFKEGWLCFKSNTADQGFTTERSNSVLAFNYLDKTYAVYTFPFNCLGFGTIIAQDTWGNNYDEWQEANYSWDSFSQTVGALANLAGDQNGIVYQLAQSSTTGNSLSGLITGATNAFQCVITSDNELSVGDYVFLAGVQGMTELNQHLYQVVAATPTDFTIDVDSTLFGTYTSAGQWRQINPVLMNVVTKNFNPYMEEGQLARLGYVDFLVSASFHTSNLRIQFYVNDQLSPLYNTFYQETTLNIQSPVYPFTSQTKVWKRVYVGAVGQSHTMRIYQNIQDFTDITLDQPIRIHAIVPYFKSSGRLFQ